MLKKEMIFFSLKHTVVLQSHVYLFLKILIQKF